MARDRFIVSAGRVYRPDAYRDPETGETRYVEKYVHAIGFSTAYGIEYTHRHPFPDSPTGLTAAERLARRVEAVLNVRGIAGLDLDCWVDRVMYGTQAYLDEEPFTVEREKADALLSEFA